MSRVKRGVQKTKKRRDLKRATKGYRWGRKNKRRFMHEAMLHAWQDSYKGRKEKKRDFAKLWNVRVNAGLRQNGMTYSKFMGKLRAAGIKLNNKVLSEMAATEPKAFTSLVKEVMSDSSRQ